MKRSTLEFQLKDTGRLFNPMNFPKKWALYTKRMNLDTYA